MRTEGEQKDVNSLLAEKHQVPEHKAQFYLSVLGSRLLITVQSVPSKTVVGRLIIYLDQKSKVPSV
jgi:hypothetical protein